MHLPPFKSKQEDFAAGGRVEFEGFVPPRAGRGGRVVIDGFWIRIFGTITVGVANWDGRDVARLIQHIAIETRSGRQRWSLSGFKTRIMSMLINGADRHVEHADVAVGAGAAVDLLLYVPMEKRFLVRGTDFSLAADVFSKVVINWNSLAGAQTGATTLAADSLDCYVLAKWHEENAVEVKAEDSIKSLNFPSQTQCTVKLTGALHDAIIVRENTTAAGGLITGITTVRCDELGIPPHERVDLLRWYREKRALGNTGDGAIGTERFNDPFVDGQAMPLIVADDDTSLWSGKVVEQAKFDLGAGAADLALVTREVLPKSEADFNAQAAQFGIDPKSLRMKTMGKSRRSLDKWGKREKQVGVWSAPLPGM